MGADIPLQPVIQAMVKHIVPPQSSEDRGGAHIQLQPTEDTMLEQVDVQRSL